METHYDADDVLGAPVSDLWEILAGTLEFGARVRAAERYLFRWANFEECNTVSTTAAALLAGSAGRVSIHNLATHFNVSVRQLERSFLSEMGVTPKRFARVARFQAALDTRVRMPDRSWLAIATDSGYHDQMHLVHDFVDFAGLPPTLTVKQLGDSRPSALAAANRVNDN
jgi:methylphosphotriester-DNA--protein-cysteine methyltransferase